jgi:lipid-A-disaccharide synthase
VLHLGGDPAYALILGRLLGVAVWTYGTSARYRRSFSSFLVPDDRTHAKLVLRGVRPDIVRVVGQLVTDSVLTGSVPHVQLNGTASDVVFLPGSRDAYAEFMTPYFARVAEHAYISGMRVNWTVAVSPFMGVNRIVALLEEAGWSSAIAGEHVQVSSPAGAQMRVVAGGLERVQTAGLVVTIPGTNTLQLAAMGMPHLVVTPTHEAAERVALDGIAGLLKPSWWGATRIRRFVIDRIDRRNEFLAIPNIIAGEQIVPEMRGRVEPGEVAVGIRSLLAADDDRRAMSARLKAVAGPPGAGERIVGLVREQIDSHLARSRR